MKKYYHWVGADLYIALTRCVCTTSTAMRHMNHFHESNCKQYCMLIQCIAGRYINPRLPVVRKINRCKHDATTPSGCACHPSTGGELAVRYFFNSPTLGRLHCVCTWRREPDGVVFCIPTTFTSTNSPTISAITQYVRLCRCLGSRLRVRAIYQIGY